MNRYKLTTNLWLDEYIPKGMYEEYQHRLHILVGLIDKRVIEADQLLRDHFGPVAINNWWHGGEREWSGLRTPGTPFYSPTSQHTYGRASDKIFINATAEDVREYIKKSWRVLGITCIEDKVSWVHSDVRMLYDPSKLLIVQP